MGTQRREICRESTKRGLPKMQSPPRRTAKDLVPHMVDEAIIIITLCNIMSRKTDKSKAKLSLAKSKKSNKKL